MKNILLLSLIILLNINGYGQTVIDMQLPAQPADSLQIVKLFDEPIPVGFPVVLSVIGFDIKGGSGENVLNWYKNSELIGTGLSIAFTPVSGSNYSLVVRDKNKCEASNSLNISALNKTKIKNYLTETIEISPKLAKDFIDIRFKSYFSIQAYLKIFDMNGKLCLNTMINGDTHQPLTLPDGTYFLIIGNGEIYGYDKIIIKN